jgi:protein-serine/threonine kinase
MAKVEKLPSVRRLSFVKKFYKMNCVEFNFGNNDKTSTICKSGKFIREIGTGTGSVIQLYSYSGKKYGIKADLFAMKLFREKLENETERDFFKKVSKEFCISSNLYHPNVVKTYELFENEEHRWCQVMEFCSGGDLLEVIKHGTMKEREVGCCFKQICSGLNYLHSIGVAHRDLKPENILINDGGELKIIDFGLAEVVIGKNGESNKLVERLCGSGPYIAPEAYFGSPYNGKAADIWALGIILYAMVFKGIPWMTATIVDSNYVFFTEDPNKFPPMSRLGDTSQKDLFLKLLQIESEERLTIEDIEKNSWFNGIEVCDPYRNCDVSGNNHSHFLKDYVKIDRVIVEEEFKEDDELLHIISLYAY